jgi:hypothetical protein
MTDEISASLTTHWQKLLLHAIATAYDIGFYLILWAGVLCVYLMRLAALALGFDSEVVAIIRWIESGANILLFASFFARLALRALRGIRA